MRWMLIMQVDPQTAPPMESLDLAEIVAVMGAYNEELQKAGVFLTAEGLSDASEGFRVDFSSQPPVVTDGPYAEAREVIGGLFVIEAATYDEVVELAKDCPHLDFGAIEIRQVQPTS